MQKRVALVTGAARGIGAAIARELSDQGWAVAVHYNRSEAQARALAEALPDILRGRPLVCVMGALADKDFGEVARLVCSQAVCTYTLTPDSPRALNAAALAEAVRPYCPAEATESVASALNRAMAVAGNDGVILAFGSLSYLGAFRAEVRKALN